MIDNNGRRAPFSIEVKIKDESGKIIFCWRPAQHNIELGMRKTEEFVKEKLGVNV